MTKCEICGKEFDNKNSKSSLIKHQIYCEDKQKFLEKYNLTRKKIINEYNNLGSILAFKRKYVFRDNHIFYYKIFRDFKIDYSLKKSANNNKTKKRRERTNIELYGSRHNFEKNHPSRKKWQKRLLNEEGITTVFQREDVKRKSINTIVRKYKKEKWLHNITVRGRGVISNINKIVFELLEKNNIEFSIEYKVKQEKRYYYSYDILIDKNKIIEVNGDYWHGNPLLYNENDLILKGTNGEIKVKDKWKRDKEKIDYIKSKGYQVLIIWEYDLKNNYKKISKKIIEYAKS